MDPHIWTENRCDVDAITKLINQGMELMQRNPLKNETVLHYCAGGHDFCYVAMDDGSCRSSHKEDSLRVVKLLVEKGADLLALDNWGFTPLLDAANGSYRRDLPNLKVLDFLLEREEYSRAEKIEAMELAGAVILKNVKNASQFHVAFDYWRKTLHLRRQMKVDHSGFIQKPRLNLKNVKAIEWDTEAELENVIEHPDKFLIQSFFVRFRIFSSKKWSAIKYLFENKGEILWHLSDKRRFLETFDILWAFLETLLSRSDLRKNADAQWKLYAVVKELVSLFIRLDRNSSEFWTEKIIKTSLEHIAAAIEFHYFISCYLIRFLRILCDPPQLLLNKDAMETLSKVRDQRGRNLLHEAVFVATSGADLYPTVRILLNSGCDPNAIEKIDGNAPLHFLAQLDEKDCIGNLNVIAVLLLDFGAQLSLKNVVGKTAADLLIQKQERMLRNKNENQEIVNWKLPEWCTELPTLQCLSARVIRRNRIPYLKLPATLISMVEKHK